MSRANYIDETLCPDVAESRSLRPERRMVIDRIAIPILDQQVNVTTNGRALPKQPVVKMQNVRTIFIMN